MTTKEQAIGQNQANRSGSNPPGEESSSERPRTRSRHHDFLLNYLYTDCYNSKAHAIRANDEAVKTGVSKWNYAEKEGKNGKNSLRNPLIFREIPRNYGFWRIIFLSGTKKQ